ncbi:helix-turn-helix transcriptional regulator [Chromobacterium alkanivorans]|uniref:helix-turn-helix domain-containing protein n=1 Tax=Chromobacterium alkanivorans TaxID=1071719 RepID=UPI0030846B5E
MDFHERLNLLKRRKRVPARVIAKECGVSMQTVYNWLKYSMPDSSNMTRLCAYFGVTPDWLLYGRESVGRELLLSELNAILPSIAENRLSLLLAIAIEFMHADGA